MATPRKSNRKTSCNALPGSIYLNKNRFWWKVQLPGEPKAKARPFRPIEVSCGGEKTWRLRCGLGINVAGTDKLYGE